MYESGVAIIVYFLGVCTHVVNRRYGAGIARIVIMDCGDKLMSCRSVGSHD